MTVDRIYLTDIEVARMLGRSKNWLCDKRPELEREGFPRVDRLIGLTCRWDVEAWIARRRQVLDAVKAGEHHAGQPSKNNEDFDAF